MEKKPAQYGTWSSDFTPQILAQDLKFSDVQADSMSPTVVWRETRGKHGVLVSYHPEKGQKDLTSTLNVKAKVGYGGGDFTLAHGKIAFVADDGRIYLQDVEQGQAQAITPSFGLASSPCFSPSGKQIVYVHHHEGKDVLALVNTEGDQWPQILYSKSDFVMQPAWSSDEKEIAFIAWNHPQMPWDGSELLLYDIESKKISSLCGSSEVSIFQPSYAPNGRYVSYISNKNGWGQLYVYDRKEKEHQQLTKESIEYGLPGWIQGMRTYCWHPNSEEILACSQDKGRFQIKHISLLHTKTQTLSTSTPYTFIAQPSISADGSTLFCLASSPKIPPRVISIDKKGECTTIRRSSSETFMDTFGSKPQAINWKGHDGEQVYGIYWPPFNTRFTSTGQPPLIVDIHGGPTTNRTIGYDPEAIFYTQRGFAYLQVNYRGSFGYGREYMRKLTLNWGVYDVEDAASGAQYLVREGLADASKLVIKGGSAGGFTVLQSLVTKPGFYRAAICLYGVSNQFLLASDTHKFEKHYLDTLLGPLPKSSAIYKERSPYFHAERIEDSLALFQGVEDQVVPKNQSDCIAQSLDKRGIPLEYHVYEGEGHGWRKIETIEHYYATCIRFLKQHVIFT
jgi:dipeptidyl aminopeptidase/acylaminoacyl peptidase